MGVKFGLHTHMPSFVVATQITIISHVSFDAGILPYVLFCPLMALGHE